MRNLSLIDRPEDMADQVNLLSSQMQDVKLQIDQTKRERKIALRSSVMGESLSIEYERDLRLLKWKYEKLRLERDEAQRLQKLLVRLADSQAFVERAQQGLLPDQFESLWRLAQIDPDQQALEVAVQRREELLATFTELNSDAADIEFKLNKFSLECRLLKKDPKNHTNYEWSRRAERAKNRKLNKMREVTSEFQLLKGKIRNLTSRTTEDEFQKVCWRRLPDSVYQALKSGDESCQYATCSA